MRQHALLSVRIGQALPPAKRLTKIKGASSPLFEKAALAPGQIIARGRADSYRVSQKRAVSYSINSEDISSEFVNA
jgi:hypothetical protein